MQNLKIIPVANKSSSIALVGCGAIADSFYLPCLAKLRSADSIVLVDNDESRRRAAAIKFGLSRTMSDYTAALREVSAVILAVPHRLHYSMAKQALESGVHVLVEKPLTANHDEAAELVALAERNELQLLVNNTRRLFPSYSRIRQFFASNELGAPLSIDWCEGDQFQWPTTSGFYFQTSSQPRGVLLDLGAHAIDALCWWLGRPPQVVASQCDSFGGPEATAHVTLRAGACDISLRLSWLSKQRNSIRIRFERGVVEAGVWDWNALTITPSDLAKRQLKLGNFSSYADFAEPLLTNFANSISWKNARAAIKGADVLPSLSVLDHCYASMRRFALPWYPELIHVNK
jgi:UDP-N-acetylglucosamine 3-dehydrogenase